jgi:hypothetical protein
VPKLLFITSFLIFFSIGRLLAQDTHKDSVIKIAQHDGAKFRLSEKKLRKFKRDRELYTDSILNAEMGHFRHDRNPFRQNPFDNKIPPPSSLPNATAQIRRRVDLKYNNDIDSTSDFFKPLKENVIDTALLADSDYVHTFRATAFKKAVTMRTKAHYITVYGSIAIGIAAMVGAFYVVVAFFSIFK